MHHDYKTDIIKNRYRFLYDYEKIMNILFCMYRHATW